MKVKQNIISKFSNNQRIDKYVIINILEFQSNEGSFFGTCYNQIKLSTIIFHKVNLS